MSSRPQIIGERETRTATCETHGEFESIRQKFCGRFTSWTECEKCDAAEKAERERTEAEASYLKRLEYARIPRRFQGKTFEQYNAENAGQQRALLVARQYAEKFAEHRADGRCLVMVGEPGTGKTHLALAVGQTILRAGYSVRYTTVHEAIEAIRETWRADGREPESVVVKRFATPDLLILDEVGVQYGKESEQVELFKILNKRYNDVLPTLVLSNVEPDELKRYLGDRAVDRLRENGGKIIPFKWESARGK